MDRLKVIILYKLNHNAVISEKNITMALGRSLYKYFAQSSVSVHIVQCTLVLYYNLCSTLSVH